MRVGKPLYIVFKMNVHHTTMTSPPSSPSFWKDRIQASAVHLSISVLVAALAALLVFGLWYPYPYREVSGGRELFMLVVAVDVIMGPLVTLAIFDRRKPWKELRRDLFVVVMLQSSALCYGLWTVAIARPVHMVFEIDRFRIVHSIDVPDDLLSKTPQGITARPWVGPSLLGTRSFKNGHEQMEMTMTALQGVQLGFRPDLWQDYEASRQDVLRVSKPVIDLRQRFPSQIVAIDATLAGQGVSVEDARYVPLAGRKDFWTVLLDGRNGDILGFVPVDSF